MQSSLGLEGGERRSCAGKVSWSCVTCNTKQQLQRRPACDRRPATPARDRHGPNVRFRQRGWCLTCHSNGQVLVGTDLTAARKRSTADGMSPMRS